MPNEYGTKKPIIVYVAREIREELVRRAEENGRTLSNYCARILEAHISKD